MKYSSNKNFNIHGALSSHRQLLLRSQDFDTQQNIDIIFFDVKFIAIPFDINQLVIEYGADSLGSEEFKVYSENDSNEYSISANHFQVFKNDLDFTETSLGVLESKGREEKVFDSRE